MKIRHRITGVEYDCSAIDNGYVEVRTNMDYLKQHDPEKYQHITGLHIQKSQYYIKEHFSDFEVVR